jgi:VWFA-related protein
MKVPVLLAVVAVAFWSLASPAAQTPQATFRSAVDLVDVEVSVLDRHRLPVRGLSASDFTVREEGEIRPIVAFSPVDLPPRVLPPAPWMERVAFDTHSNEFAKEGRLVVILLDISVAPTDWPEARRIAEGAVHQLRAGDMAAVAWSLHGVPQNFTADRERLLEVIRDPVVNAPDAGARSSECYCGRCSMESIANVAEAVQNINWRRKMLLFIGSRLPGRGGGACSSINDAPRRRALRAAEVGNLTIHVIDPRGVVTLATPAASRTVSGPAPGAELRRIAALTLLTEPTGGRLVTQNRPSEALPELFRESASYYVLGFEPGYTGTDGRFRRISVRVNRQGVTLQARRGYYAPGGRAPSRPDFGDNVPPALADAIGGLWPRTDLRLSLGASPVAVPGVRGGAVAVVVRAEHDTADSRTGDPRATGGPRPAQASVLVGAFDHMGRAVALDRQVVNVAPQAADDGSVGYEVASRLQLRPGRYEIRAAVEDSTLGQAGSAYTYIDVPDFARELVSLSGMFLQAGSPEPVPGARLADLTPITPTTRRRFSRNETVTAFVREYQSAVRTFMPGYALTEITDSTDTAVYRQQQRILPVAEGHHPMDFRVDVPIGRLPPGPYLLTFEVRHGNDTARRDVRFEVE